MKDLVVVIVIIIIVFVPGYFAKKYLEDSGNNIVEKIEIVEDEIKNGNTNNINELEKIKDEWDKVQHVWNILSNHQNTDEIQREFEMLIVNYEGKEHIEAIINITEIKTMIRDIPKGEAISLVNIL